MAPSGNSNITNGNVARLMPDFGFLRDANGTQYFFHRSSCRTYDDLTVGTPVSFRPKHGPKGWRAIDVRQPRAEPSR